MLRSYKAFETRILATKTNRMAVMKGIPVLLGFLAIATQLRTTRAADSDAVVGRKVDDAAILAAIKDAETKTNEEFNANEAIKLGKTPATTAPEIVAARPGDGGASGLAPLAPIGVPSPGSITAGQLLGFFREAAGETRQALQSGENWEQIAGKLDIRGVEDKFGNYNLTVQLSEDQMKTISQRINCSPEISVDRCPTKDVYRTINGACNNRKNPTLGAANTAFTRSLPAQYEDGFSQPQGWTEGKLYNGFPLPEVRDVSNKIARYLEQNVVLDKERSHMFMEWGQFCTHDIEFSPQGITNCAQRSCVKQGNSFPIKIPPNDPSANAKGPCMSFIRTGPACRANSMVRQQLNGVTSFIDASVIYGSEACQVKMLRDLKSGLGLLVVNKWLTDNGRAYMPYVNDTDDLCPPGVSCLRKNACLALKPEKKVSCFIAGDRRANLNLELLTVNTLFVREHNRLARELKRLNPHWDGETLYQEARKINGALIQIITYRDYLPMLLGERTEAELPPYNRYNEKENPAITNIFSIAFRSLHTSIPPWVFRLNSQYKPTDQNSRTPFHETLFATWMLVEQGGIDSILRGLLVNGAKLLEQDKMISDEIRDKLFGPANNPAAGLDLASFDMQRGRDHGLPRYNAWRKFCGLSQPHNEDELARVLKNRQLARKFMALYKTPDNIDFWIGAIAEPLVEKARVGPLLACLIGKQFRKLRDGDRFWWQNPGVFTPQQRAALSRTSLSRIICDNSGLKEVARNVFKANVYPRDFQKCSSINNLDLSPWVESRRPKELSSDDEPKHGEL